MPPTPGVKAPLPGELLADLLVSIALAKGDVVVLYTDGLVRGEAGAGEIWAGEAPPGLDAHAGLPAPELGERLLSDLEGFLGDDSPADDVTLIVVKVL